MVMPNVFDGDAFNAVSLTAALAKIPAAPTRVEAMRLFTESGVAGKVVAVEERDGVLALVPNKRWGEPGTPLRSGKRRVRQLPIPHLPVIDAVTADSLIGVRRFGSESEVEGTAQVVNDRLVEMRASVLTTKEYHRVNALNGVILDADGDTEIIDLFTVFGVTRHTTTFALSNAATNVKGKLLEVKRTIEKAVGAMPIDHVHGFAGEDWFDAYITHPKVEAAYNRSQELLARTDVRKGFEFCGVTIEEYTGKIGEIDFVDPAACIFFPVGPPIYATFNGPGCFWSAAGSIGLPIYARGVPRADESGMDLYVEANPLSICLLPRALVLGAA